MIAVAKNDDVREEMKFYDKIRLRIIAAMTGVFLMSDLNITQSAFNAGELSPRLYSRVNLENMPAVPKLLLIFTL